jgi:hypothetical protein
LNADHTLLQPFFFPTPVDSDRMQHPQYRVDAQQQRIKAMMNGNFKKFRDT